jgi:8-oxo-dGTP pyrophosphatase MutT (NUDIX family)
LVVEELAELGHDLLLPARSDAVGYFEERGYLRLGLEGALLRLQAPTQVANRRAAASVCLFESASRQVLIGQRLTPPWPGYWAFPGGKLEPGEPPLTGALRELHEETGIGLPPTPDVLLQTRVYAGGSGTVYGIDNFCLRAAELYPPELSLPELRPYWVTLDSAAELRPMAAGTRRVIRKIRQMAPG